jgi:hypothetical protein
MAGTAPLAKRRQSSFDDSRWLPTYAWWPPSDRFSATVLLSTFLAGTTSDVRVRFALRGYAGSADPLWAYDLGTLTYGEQHAVRLHDLDLPPAPADGGLLEVHAVRLDREPDSGSGYLGMWVDAEGLAGGGYLIPSTPIRGAAKVIRRDDVQVVPGILASRDVDTELLLLNPYDVRSSARLVAWSIEGLSASSDAFEIEPWSAWHDDLGNRVERLRALLAPAGGIGSLAIHTTHKVLPFFGFRHRGNPVVSMDHSAPIFG